jgi:hypothetical protein
MQYLLSLRMLTTGYGLIRQVTMLIQSANAIALGALRTVSDTAYKLMALEVGKGEGIYGGLI